MNPRHDKARGPRLRALGLAVALLLAGAAWADGPSGPLVPRPGVSTDAPLPDARLPDARLSEALLPDTPQVLAAIDQHPAVVQATLGQDAARHAAGMLATGPQEWTVGGQLQQRRVNGAGSAAEWQLELSRPIRWGDKARLDRQLGEHGEQIARWQRAVARRESASALLDAWLDWRGAQAARALAEAQLGLAEEQLKVVALRQRAGDAARLDRLAAEADLADQRRAAAAARTAEARAAMVLAARFPGLPTPGDAAPLPAPPAPWGVHGSTVAGAGVAVVGTGTGTGAGARGDTGAGGDEPLPAPDRAAAIDQAPTVRLAEAALAQAEALSARTRAERRPDPTVGVYTALEAARTERVVGLSVSIPIGGAYRDLAAREQAAREAAARAALDAARRERAGLLRQWLLERDAGHARWRLAEAAAAAQQEAASLMRKAYAAGEAEMPALLQARRLALEAAQTALAARVDALRAHHRLALETGRLWPGTGT